MPRIENQTMSKLYLENSELNDIVVGNKKSTRIGKSTYSRPGYSDLTVSDLKLSGKNIYSETTDFINFTTRNLTPNLAIKVVLSDVNNTTVYKRIQYLEDERNAYITRDVLDFEVGIYDIEYIEYDMEFNLATNTSKLTKDQFTNLLGSGLTSGVNIITNCTDFSNAGTGDNILIYDKEETKLAGVVSIIAGTNIVAGSGTSFFNELKVGEFIEIGSYEAKIASIQNNTQMLLEVNFIEGFTDEFIYKVSNPNESQVSIIKGLYSRDENLGMSNVENPFILKPNRTVFFKLGANKVTNRFNGTSIDISSLSSYTLFQVRLNGKLLTKNDYSISGSTLDFSNSDYLRTSYNYYTLLYYQTDQNTDDFYAKLQYKSYDKVFLLEPEEFTQLYDLCELDIEGFSSSQNITYHIVETLDLKQNKRIKIDENNKLTFSVYIAFDEEQDENSILENLKLKLRDESNFRFIRYVPESDKQEIYNNVQLNDGVQVSMSKTNNRYDYSFDYQQRLIAKPKKFGDNLFSQSAYFGLEIISD